MLGEVPSKIAAGVLTAVKAGTEGTRVLLAGVTACAGRKMHKAYFEGKNNFICTKGSVSGISMAFWQRPTEKKCFPLFKLFPQVENSAEDLGDVHLGCIWASYPRTLKSIGKLHGGCQRISLD